MGETLNLSLIFSLNPFSFSQKMRTISLSTIQARNNVNDFANIISKDLHDKFQPLLGKKIRKISGYGGWIKSVEKMVNEFRNDNNFLFVGFYKVDRIKIYASYTSLICEVQVWEPESRTYVCNSIYFGRFDDATGILTHLSEPTEYRVDYEKEQLDNAIQKVAELKAQLKDAESILKEFSR